MILVFLHGKGSDKNAYIEQLKNLAAHLSADLVSFNAPFLIKTKKINFFGLISLSKLTAEMP